MLSIRLSAASPKGLAEQFHFVGPAESYQFPKDPDLQWEAVPPGNLLSAKLSKAYTGKRFVRQMRAIIL